MSWGLVRKVQSGDLAGKAIWNMSLRFLVSVVAAMSALAAVMVGLDTLPALATLVALLFGIIVWQEVRDKTPTDPGRQVVVTRSAAHAIDSVIGAFELPAVLLDSGLDVRAHNRAARESFPQLRLGEPLSPAVRNPELLNAAIDALQSKSSRSVQILNRIPFDRRLLATLVPLELEQENAGSEEATKSLFLLLQIVDLTEQSRLAQMRSDFIANASHELRTPLSSLRGFIETLRGAARDDRASQDKFLLIMEEQALRMTRILDDLLCLSRIEMHAHLPPETTVDLVEIVSSAVRSLEPIARDANIKISFHAAGVPINVKGNKSELEQVFQNLMHNAIKYGRENGKVGVAFGTRPSKASSHRRISVQIADDGPGISEEHLPRLTERFYRVDTAASRDRGGTGLGLAIVKHIITRHRGDLEIVSKLGSGSTFTVILDASPD